MKQILIFIVAILMASCTNSFNEMNAPYEDDLNSSINLFDSVSYVSYVDSINKGLDVHCKVKTLHIKYEDNTLWLYFDMNNVKRFDNIVYTDLEETTYTIDTNLPYSTTTFRTFYNKDTHQNVFFVTLKTTILVKIDENYKKFCESSRYCSIYTIKHKTIDETYKYIKN